MAKKKKTATPSFDPGRFRQAEEASMAGFTPAQPAPVVDERTQVRAKLGLPPLEVSTTDTTEVPTMDPREGVKEGAGSPTIVSRVDNGDGTFTITFSDGTVQTTGTKIITKSSSGGGKKVVSTYTDPTTGDVIAVYDDGTTAIISKGGKLAAEAASAAAAKLKEEQDAAAAAEAKLRAGQSAFDLLRMQFEQYGLGALVSDVEKYIKDGLSQAEFTLRLRTESDAYKKRFAANQSRIQKGLRALSEGEYITLEDQYQNVMRQYGLPASYYTRGDMGRQEGFEKFISEDVSPVELEDRISNAQERVLQSAPEVGRMLRQFYPDISNGDILAYALDPRNALNAIKRKITAAEIGAGAAQAGLATGMARAEELAQYGVSKEQARQGFSTIAEFLPTAQKLGDIYAKQGVAPFTQTTAEQEVFGLAGAAGAKEQRKKLTELEQASFSGSAGLGILARERAGQY